MFVVVLSMYNTYDEADRLVKGVITQNGTVNLTQNNLYNGNGQRIQKNDNGTITNYYYQGATALYTTDQAGDKTSFNLIGLGDNVLASGRYGTTKENENEN